MPSKRRSRSARRKQKKSIEQQTSSQISSFEETIEETQAALPEEPQYQVQSPETVKRKNSKGTIVKSKSLDDDEHLNITELQETSDNEAVYGSNVVVSEAESDIERETKTTSEEASTEEDNANLRSLLSDLDVPKPAKAESPSERRTKKREALMQYFIPVYHNPRFLEAISEESSDASDRDDRCRMKTRGEEAVLVSTRLTEIAVPRRVYEREMLENDVELVNLQESDRSADVSESDDETIVNRPEPELPPSHMTPPPTPGRLSPKEAIKKKVSGVCNEGEGESRSPSVSSNGSSSRATSLCTALYNPSLGDVASLAKDEELANHLRTLHQPLALRDLCIKSLLSLPFGADMLRELADVSKAIHEFTSKLPSNVISNLLKSSAKRTHPLLLRSFSEGCKKSRFDIPEGPKDLGRRKSDGRDRCLAQVQTAASSTSEVGDKPPNEQKDLYLYYEDNQRPTMKQTDANNARLQAKDLSEWLKLARCKSSSETNLSSIPKVQKRSVDDADRRGSLPNDFYQQQLFALREKEREIERQLEQLEEEKRKLFTEMSSSREFLAEEYTISKRGMERCVVQAFYAVD